MRKVLVIATMVVLGAYAQKTSTTSSTSADNVYGLKEKIFRDALKYADLSVAKGALYEMIALNPNQKNLKDSLALIYINMGQPQQAILLSREILMNDPANLPMLEVKAVAEQSIGMAKEALMDFETLYAKQKNIFHLYQIASLQYDLKRMAECNLSIDQILSAKDVEKQEISIGTGQQGAQQKVSLKAAALNIKGVLAMDLKENAIAKQCFEEALKINQDFVLAKNNYQFLVSKTEQAAPKTSTNTSSKNQK